MLFDVSRDRRDRSAAAGLSAAHLAPAAHWSGAAAHRPAMLVLINTNNLFAAWSSLLTMFPE